MHLKSITHEKASGGDVRLSLNRKEARTFKTVVHSLVRRAVNGQIHSALDTAMAEATVENFQDVRHGFFRTRLSLGEGILSGIGDALKTYGEIGAPEELTANPNADPLKLASVASHAGEMSIKIDTFLEALDPASEI